MRNKFVLIIVIIIFLGASISTLAAYEKNVQKNLNAPYIRVNKGNNVFQSDIEIGEISSGLGKIRVEIRNIGTEEVNDINWNITVKGGVLNLINSFSSGMIDRIQPGNSVTVETESIILGLGKIDIEARVSNINKNAEGSIFILLISINPDTVVDLELIANGFNSPVGLTHARDGSNRLFVFDQIGIIYVIENNNLIQEPFLDLTDKIVDLDLAYDERGLLGLTFHPEYENNGRFFIYYSTPKEGAGINHESILAEYSVSDNTNIADPKSEKIIYRIDQPEANHNGGQLVFGPDGYLYLGLGDGGGAGDQHGSIGNGQDINTALGSIIRIDINSGDPYSIPEENPFVNIEGLDEIYSWGFRNPWRFSFDNDKLFVADVGQDEWEEINIVEKGRNYGWRILEGTHEYDLDLADTLGIDIETLAEPIHEYSHSLGRSVTGGYVYRGTENPSLAGKYIFGDWSSSFVLPRGKLYYLEETEPGVWQRYELSPSETFNRFVLSFGEDENGEIYVLSKTSLGPTGTSGDVRKIIVK